MRPPSPPLPPPSPLPMQYIPLARRPFSPAWVVHDLKAMNVECTFCCALLWLDERLSNSSKINPRFGICCYQGKVKPPYYNPIPPELHWLLTHDDARERGFRNHIHNYNQALAFTSVGRKVDNTLNHTGGGPYSFRLFGELIHQAGSLIPPPGKPPAWAQLYIYDSAQALNYCIGHSANSTLDRNIMQTLQDMLYRHHPSVLLYKHAFQITQGMSSEQNCSIVLCFDPHTSAKINISYSILFNLTTSYSSYFGGKKGISRNKTSFFLLMYR